MRDAFTSDQALTEYCSSIGVREIFPVSWSPQIQVARTILLEAKLNEPDRFISFRLNNQRSAPGLQIELKENGEEKRLRLWIKPNFFMAWTRGQHTSVDELLEHVEKKTFIKTKPPLKPKKTSHEDPSQTSTSQEVELIEPKENVMDVEEEADDNTPEVYIQDKYF